ncbi:MAG: trehalose-phosphatase [Acetobacteraceae bacterium]|nr:trehalose-phosphatase [Acetobacteraceae bacterium]
MSAVQLPLLAQTALLLDLDGTLLDIAPAPDLVVVPQELILTLQKLRGRLGDALAVVSGRTVENVDSLLQSVPYAVAGEHGAALRLAPDAAPLRPALPSVPPEWRQSAAKLAGARPGVLLEEKAQGFVLHYRAAPDLGPWLGEELAAITRGDSRFAILPARKAWEVRPRGADKGTAVAALMDHPPFAGRAPIFIGDDVTDEDGMEAARAAGGIGLRVPEVFGSAASVRAWLTRAADQSAQNWPALNR